MSYYSSSPEKDNFLSSISSYGISRPNRFDILISNPSSLIGEGIAPTVARTRHGSRSSEDNNLVAIRCESIDLPGKTIRSVAEDNVYGPTYEIPQGITFSNSMSATFLLDRNLHVKRYFDAWQDTIHDANTFNMNYYDEYIRDMIIRQLDEQDTPIYACRIFEVYPKSVELISLNNTSRDQASKLSVTFAFRYWQEDDTAAQFAPEPIPNSLTDDRL